MYVRGQLVIMTRPGRLNTPAPHQAHLITYEDAAESSSNLTTQILPKLRSIQDEDNHN
jgi:hypothetical protein